MKHVSWPGVSTGLRILIRPPNAAYKATLQLLTLQGFVVYIIISKVVHVTFAAQGQLCKDEIRCSFNVNSSLRRAVQRNSDTGF